MMFRFCEIFEWSELEALKFATNKGARGTLQRTVRFQLPQWVVQR